jgi:hypothetical protein
MHNNRLDRIRIALRARMLGAIILVTLGTWLLPMAVHAAGVVTILDDRVVPTTVTIVVGDQVTWTNRGLSAHAVIAKKNAFSGFTLPPTGTHSLRFPKAGRYPYLVDGRMTAIVIVGSGAGAAGGGGGSGTTSSSSSNARYEVDISVTTHEHETSAREVWDATIDWTGKWEGVYYSIAPDAIGVRPRPGGVFMGTIQALEKVTLFNSMDPNKSPVQCRGDIPREAEAARLVFSSSYFGASGQMNFASSPVDGGLSFAGKLDSVKATCSEPYLLIPDPGGFDFTTPAGIEFSLDPPRALLLQFKATSTTKVPFPLDQLIAGKSFGIETGTQTKSTPSGGVVYTMDEAVSVDFKASP